MKLSVAAAAAEGRGGWWSSLPSTSVTSMPPPAEAAAKTTRYARLAGVLVGDEKVRCGARSSNIRGLVLAIFLDGCHVLPQPLLPVVPVY